MIISVEIRTCTTNGKQDILKTFFCQNGSSVNSFLWLRIISNLITIYPVDGFLLRQWWTYVLHSFPFVLSFCTCFCLVRFHDRSVFIAAMMPVNPNFSVFQECDPRRLAWNFCTEINVQGLEEFGLSIALHSVRLRYRGPQSRRRVLRLRTGRGEATLSAGRPV